DGHRNFRECGGLDIRHAFRNRHDVPGVRPAELGITAAVNEGHHPVAPLEGVHAAADFGHHARHLEPEDRAGVRWHRIAAETLGYIGTIDPGSADLDDDFTRPRDR